MGVNLALDARHELLLLLSGARPAVGKLLLRDGELTVRRVLYQHRT